MRKWNWMGIEGGNFLGWVEMEYGPGGKYKTSLVPISFPRSFAFFFLFFFCFLRSHMPLVLSRGPSFCHCIIGNSVAGDSDMGWRVRVESRIG